MPVPGPRRLLAVALLTAGAAGMACAPAAAAPSSAGLAPARSGAVAGADGGFRILDERIDESSGLALSRAHPHTVWTTNDSGDSARIFALDTRTGRTTGVHSFGAPVVDVEALAITPQGRVLVADIGDNTRSRAFVRVFWFDEPALGETSGAWKSWELTYPDGRHDAESVAVDPRTGRIIIVTKSADGGVSALPAKPSRQGVNRLERLADAPATATDAVFLADGSALAVRTYTQLVLLDPHTWQQLERSLLPLQPQGETIALAPDGTGLFIGSEGVRSSVREVLIPGASRPSTATSPAPATSQPPGSGPDPSSTSPAQSGAPATAPATTPSTTGTPRVDRTQLVAGLGGGAVLVAVALLATWIARRAQRR